MIFDLDSLDWVKLSDTWVETVLVRDCSVP